MRKDLRRVRKEDYERVLLTETSPYEVPIIFSNFGLYEILKRLNLTKPSSQQFYFPGIFDYLLKKESDSYTIPLVYRIRKDEDSFRTLSLLHPASQVDFVELYREFDLQIISACSKSRFSIRSPAKIASKYYVKGAQHDLSEFKSGKVASIRGESRQRFLTSYFSYKGFTRLHRFFDSYEFLKLERQFSSFWSLDVSKYFDSIYTHTLSWALKTKPFAKANRSVKNTLGSIFDRAMQASNYNETAGIVIGPEVSRVFAEIIFQEIDRQVEIELDRSKLKLGVDYEIRRYVDDIFIFAIDEARAEAICKVIERTIKEYKLNLNKTKTVRAARPFVTEKTKAVRAVKKMLNELKEKLVYTKADPEIKVEAWGPKRIYNRKNVIIHFANGVKSACIDDPSAYSMISGLLITALQNLVVRFSRKHMARNLSQEPATSYEDFFKITVELVFHFFTVNPSHSGSVSICRMTHITCAFFDKHFEDESNAIRSMIYTQSLEFFRSSEFSRLAKTNSDYALLEALNILATIKALGPDFKMSRQALNSVVNVSSERDLSYFEIVTMLFYVGDSVDYASIRRELEKRIKQTLSSLTDIKENTFKAYLLLDSITCPYLSEKLKTDIMKRYFKQVYGQDINAQELLALKLDFESIQGFVNWNKAALLSSLEKKELLKGY